MNGIDEIDLSTKDLLGKYLFPDAIPNSTSHERKTIKQINERHTIQINLQPKRMHWNLSFSDPIHSKLTFTVFLLFFPLITFPSLHIYFQYCLSLTDSEWVWGLRKPQHSIVISETFLLLSDLKLKTKKLLGYFDYVRSPCSFSWILGL